MPSKKIETHPTPDTLSAAQQSARKNLLAKIHIAKQQLGLDDDDYRCLLDSLIALQSCKTATIDQLETVMREMCRLGFRAKQSNRSLSPPTKHNPEHEQIDKIRALWIDLGRRGVVRSPTEESLRKFAKRICKVDRLEWLSIEQCSAVIAALNNMSES